MSQGVLTEPDAGGAVAGSTPHIGATGRRGWAARVGRRAVRPVVLAGVLGLLYLYASNQDLDSIEQRSLNARTLRATIWHHIELTAVSTVLVLVVAITLGLVLTRRFARPFVPPVLSVANIGQAAPAIGVLALLTFWLGIGFATAVVALSLYSLLPVLRNTIVGIEQVDRSLVDAGRGMGMTGLGVLLRVELPLAVPVILAGVRTALVLNVGTATLATFINAGGLGSLIVTGIKLDRQPILVTGAVLTAVLALLIDWLAGIAHDVLHPKGVDPIL